MKKINHLCFKLLHNYNNNELHLWAIGLGGRHAGFYCTNCCGFKSLLRQHFLRSTNCCFSPGCYVGTKNTQTKNNNLCFKYVCKVPHDTVLFLVKELVLKK